MNTEQWDYKIDGKIGGITRIVIGLVLSVFFVVLTIDQLQPQPNKSMMIAFSFGSAAVIALYLLITLSIRYFCFKVYIGSEGFYFQSTPFNGKYYEYIDIQSCKEELKIYRHRHSPNLHYFYFIFTDQNGKTIKFLFEKPLCEREIKTLKKRIENQSLKNSYDPPVSIR